MQTATRDLTTSIGLLILRVGIGGYMLTHGIGKVQMLIGGQYDQFNPIGLGPTLSILGIVLAEFVAAILVMIGLATRPAAGLVVFAMGVAAFVAHGSDPWTAAGGYALFSSGQSESWASKEPALVFLIAFLALVFTGPGRFSIDELLRRRFAPRERAASTPAAASGAAAA